MKIVILGWGSLLWDPKNLVTIGEWQRNGPILPLEFSRVSKDGRLTLVIDSHNGENISTFYILSGFFDLAQAIVNLRKREGTSTDKIGFVDCLHEQHHSRLSADVTQSIREWAIANAFDAVIWTDLGSNFQEKQGEPFTVDNAVVYLNNLPIRVAQDARRYVQRSPREVETPLRRKLRQIGWYEENEGENA